MIHIIIIKVYRKNYDLIYVYDFLDNHDNLYLKHIPNKDKNTYGIKWCNNSKKFIFNHI